MRLRSFYNLLRSGFQTIYNWHQSFYNWLRSRLQSPYNWLRSWLKSIYDWLHFGYSHKRRRRAGYPECPDTEKTKRLEEAWNRIKFWQKTPDVYECQNDDPVLQIDWYERHLMDIGYMEETYEYYRAKQKKKSEWTKEDEENYENESDPKIPYRRIEPLLKIDLKDRRDMEIGFMEETYEYYCAKKFRNNEKFLDEEEWTIYEQLKKRLKTEVVYQRQNAVEIRYSDYADNIPDDLTIPSISDYECESNL